MPRTPDNDPILTALCAVDRSYPIRAEYQPHLQEAIARGLVSVSLTDEGRAYMADRGYCPPGDEASPAA